MKPPPRALKRKRTLDQDEQPPRKIVKSRKVEQEQSAVVTFGNGPIAPRDTTSETSALTSADEIATATTATGVDSDECKYTAQNGRLSVEGTQTAGIVTAYRNATEILVEVANRNCYRAHSNYPYSGFGGPPAHNTPYPNQPMSHYPTPLASFTANNYAKPYANPEPTVYVTPYANPPVVAEPSGNGQINKGYESKPQAARPPGPQKAIVTSDGPKEANEVTAEVDDNVAKPKKSAKEKELPLSLGLLDGFLALANGGVLPGQKEDSDGSKRPQKDYGNDELPVFAPPSPGDTIDEAMSRVDDDILALVNRIAEDLINSQEPPPPVPPVNSYAAFYSSSNGKQLGADFKRLVGMVQPEVNTIMPREQIQAAHLFYTHLMNCIHTRNAIHGKPIRPYSLGPPPVMDHRSPGAFPQPRPPNGYMVSPVQWPNQFTSPPPMPQAQSPTPAFVPRGNVIAPPVVRNLVEEQKVAVFGFPPVPSPRSGLRSGINNAMRKQME